MHDRNIIDIHDVEFKPFDRYGAPVPKMSWHIISYNQDFRPRKLCFKDGSWCSNYCHTPMWGSKNFLIVEGELIDSDGMVFKKGEFVSFEPGSQHSSFSENRGLNYCVSKEA